jgi:hypothetical protein
VTTPEDSPRWWLGTRRQGEWGEVVGAEPELGSGTGRRRDVPPRQVTNGRNEPAVEKKIWAMNGFWPYNTPATGNWS